MKLAGQIGWPVIKGDRTVVELEDIFCNSGAVKSDDYRITDIQKHVPALTAALEVKDHRIYDHHIRIHAAKPGLGSLREIMEDLLDMEFTGLFQDASQSPRYDVGGYYQGN